MPDQVTGSGSEPADGPIADEYAPIEPVEVERVFTGRVWNLRRDTVEYGDGRIVREYVDHTGAVAVLALDDDDRAFLIQQYRHPVRTRDWEIPAGLLDIDGEPPLEAAQRELAEEADLEADDWSVLTEFYNSPGGSDEALRIYLARGLRPTAEPFPREAEEADMQTRWVPLDELVEAVLARRVQNAALVIAALAASASRAAGWATLAPADAPWPAHPKLGRRTE
ncbi:NUDIX domain-containing protein [Agromyces mangrovi Wang et al. 2018]|uniref:NUDIX domain-containing protein n=1 Tax=Agromyces mangrovi TaxID=1858653 RepID=UPI0025748197|nr:NUDIX hydrolase [Agromyces mangrovi]